MLLPLIQQSLFTLGPVRSDNSLLDDENHQRSSSMVTEISRSSKDLGTNWLMQLYHTPALSSCSHLFLLLQTAVRMIFKPRLCQRQVAKAVAHHAQVRSQELIKKQSAALCFNLHVVKKGRGCIHLKPITHLIRGLRAMLSDRQQSQAVLAKLQV